jgi:hypothetical protein
VIDYLEAVRVGKNRPMADGGYAESSISTPNYGANSTASISTNNTTDTSMNGIMAQVSVFLKYLINNGVYIDKTAKNGKLISEMLDDWNTLKNKNKY